jgi:hypothetical protein
MSTKIDIELSSGSCRFCSLVFGSERSRRRHEQKQHNEEYSVCKQRGSVQLTVLTGFRKCVFCRIFIKDNEESRVNHSQSEHHVHRRSLFPSFNEEEIGLAQSCDRVVLLHERTTSQSFVACANSSNVDHEESE